MKNKRVSASLVLIIIFVILTVLVYTGGLALLESRVYGWLAGGISPPLTAVFTVITHAGSAVGVIGVIALMLLLPQTRVKIGVPIAVTAVIAAALNFLLKNIIMRPRPQVLWLVQTSGYAFPSGHSMNNAALYAMLVLLIFGLTKTPKIRVPALTLGVLMPFLIGVSRIYLGVHNAGDVLAGWALGTAVALLVSAAWEKRQANKSNHST